jgi:hypothetical protein
VAVAVWQWRWVVALAAVLIPLPPGSQVPWRSPGLNGVHSHSYYAGVVWDWLCNGIKTHASQT